MKRKRKLFDNYDDLLSDYYGFNKKIKITTATNFDDGGVIPQPLRAYGQSIEEEYIVQASALPGESEEEYVVEQSTPNESEEEEYVVGYSFSPADSSYNYITKSFNTIENNHDVINSLSYYSSDPTLSNQPINSNPTGTDQEYQTSILEPFASSNTLSAQAQSLNTYDTPPTFPLESNINQTRTSAPDHQPLANPNTSETQSAKEQELINDLQAILSGQKVYDSVSGKTVDRSELGKQQSIEPNAPKTKQADPSENPHAIFDRIKENMQYANAYNLGTIPLNTSELEKRFDDLDAINQTEKKINQVKKTVSKQPKSNKKLSSEMDFDPTEFLHDLEDIQKKSNTNQVNTAPPNPSTTSNSLTVDIHSTNYPERPTTIRPYNTSERLQIYGHFDYEPDPSTFNGDGIRVLGDWRNTNITNVSIPQLNGKRFGNQTIQNGTIAFHRLGADALIRLWAAWEAAGLLDRIQTFEGGYAPRFIRGTQSRSPRPLSNHAWGTAFDINAPWNTFGGEPALVGQNGSVRELVTIAGNNGFFWGGHFNGHKDGMHFELGKVL
ncbi:MAG: M15 family metallopeptidase [Sphingobacteriaceae bacterium]